MPSTHDDNVRRHPSYATVSVVRAPHGTSKALFQSDFEHHQTVYLEIHSAEVLRTNSEDHIISQDRLISIEMSPIQFADLLTGFGATGPVPATLRFLVGDQTYRPDPPNHNVQADFTNEHRQAIDDIIASLDELLEQTNLPAAARRKAQGIRASIINRLPFIEDQFEKHLNHTVADAKASISAFAEHRERLAGRQALTDEYPDAATFGFQLNDVNDPPNPPIHPTSPSKGH